MIYKFTTIERNKVYLLDRMDRRTCNVVIPTGHGHMECREPACILYCADEPHFPTDVTMCAGHYDENAAADGWPTLEELRDDAH